MLLEWIWIFVLIPIRSGQSVNNESCSKCLKLSPGIFLDFPKVSSYFSRHKFYFYVYGNRIKKSKILYLPGPTGQWLPFAGNWTHVSTSISFHCHARPTCQSGHAHWRDAPLVNRPVSLPPRPHPSAPILSPSPSSRSVLTDTALIVVSFVERFSSGGGVAIVPATVMTSTHSSRIMWDRDQACAVWVHLGSLCEFLLLLIVVSTWCCVWKTYLGSYIAPW
jgi:hypothetical protein